MCVGSSLLLLLMGTQRKPNTLVVGRAGIGIMRGEKEFLQLHTRGLLSVPQSATHCRSEPPSSYFCFLRVSASPSCSQFLFPFNFSGCVWIQLYLSISPKAPIQPLPQSPSVSSFQVLGEDLAAPLVFAYVSGYPEDCLPLGTASCNPGIGSHGSKHSSLGSLLHGGRR